MVGIIIMLIVLWFYPDTRPYYEKYNYIAHALGGIDGKDYTNSKEAMELSYKNGLRLIEFDLLYTSDGHLIARHNWNTKLEDGFSGENVPDYDTYMKSKIYDTYTTVDIETILQFAMEHPDVYFITDVKPKKVTLTQTLEKIKETAEAMGYKNFEKQFIVQFYSYEDYEQISKEFNFSNYIFTLYRMKGELRDNGIENILNFCVENKIKVVTIPKKFVTKEICDQLNEKGISVLVNTIDDKQQWKELKEMGVSGIYTNYITPKAVINKTIIAKGVLLCILAGLGVALYICIKGSQNIIIREQIENSL